MNSKKLIGEKQEDWRETQKDLRQKIIDGSAGSMEPVGMARIFKRSAVKYGLKCATCLGDEDSKTHRFIILPLKNLNAVDMCKKDY